MLAVKFSTVAKPTHNCIETRSNLGMRKFSDRCLLQIHKKFLKSLTATSMYPVPSEQPQNVYAKDKASATVIYLSWKSPPEHTIHGILRGYYIWYSIIRLGIYDKTPVFPQDYRKKQLPTESKSDALTELESYATYDIRIAAFTSKGYGPIKALSSSKRDYSWYLTI